jgi:hypothetical protein
MSEQGMKPIWYFVGLIVLVIGGLIFCSGIYLLLNPPVVKTVLAELHPNLWWGGVMIIFGTGLYIKMKNKTR